MKLKNPTEAMISKFEPNLIFFETARSSNVVMFCYPCIKTARSQPSER